MRFRELDPSGRLSTGYIASIIPGALLACVAAALVSAPLASLRADDIAPDQIEQLQKRNETPEPRPRRVGKIAEAGRRTFPKAQCHDCAAQGRSRRNS